MDTFFRTGDNFLMIFIEKHSGTNWTGDKFWPEKTDTAWHPKIG